jgi:hypothetical protein
VIRIHLLVSLRMGAMSPLPYWAPSTAGLGPAGVTAGPEGKEGGYSASMMAGPTRGVFLLINF